MEWTVPMTIVKSPIPERPSNLYRKGKGRLGR